MDITGVKSKRNPELLTPAQILLMKPSDLAAKPKKIKKRRKTKKNKRKKQRRTRKKRGGTRPGFEKRVRNNVNLRIDSAIAAEDREIRKTPSPFLNFMKTGLYPTYQEREESLNPKGLRLK